MTEGNGIELAKATANRMGVKQVHVFKNFGTVMFRAREYEIEFRGGAEKKATHEEAENLL